MVVIGSWSKGGPRITSTTGTISTLDCTSLDIVLPRHLAWEVDGSWSEPAPLDSYNPVKSVEVQSPCRVCTTPTQLLATGGNTIPLKLTPRFLVFIWFRNPKKCCSSKRNSFYIYLGEKKKKSYSIGLKEALQTKRRPSDDGLQDLPEKILVKLF